VFLMLSVTIIFTFLIIIIIIMTDRLKIVRFLAQNVRYTQTQALR